MKIHKDKSTKSERKALNQETKVHSVTLKNKGEILIVRQKGNKESEMKVEIGPSGLGLRAATESFSGKSKAKKS